MNSSNRKYASIAIVLSLLTISALVIDGYLKKEKIRQLSEKYSKQERLKRSLHRVAKQLNDENPCMLSDELRRDSVVVGPGLMMTMTYTLVGASKSDVSEEQKELLREMVQDTYNTAESSKFFRTKMIPVTMLFKDMHGNRAYRFVIR